MSRMTHEEKDALIVRLRQRITELYAELAEETRLNGMGAEREAKLLARIEEQERDLERFDWFKACKCKAELECAKKAERIEELEVALRALADEYQYQVDFDKHHAKAMAVANKGGAA